MPGDGWLDVRRTAALWDELRPEGAGVYVNFLEDEGDRKHLQALQGLPDPLHTRTTVGEALYGLGARQGVPEGD